MLALTAVPREKDEPCPNHAQREAPLTEDAHEILALADLEGEALIALVKECFLLIVYLRSPPMHGVNDTLQCVQPLHRDPLQRLPTECWAADERDVWHGPSEDGEVVQRWTGRGKTS